MFGILSELGYEKRKCDVCEQDFWSLKERSTCGDAPCDEYGFIGDPATENSYDLYEIQRIFIEFFEKRGHVKINRYPVLAKRWRDDVFLVGASIYDFQPWVTSGLVEPPANPLTIAQPSIRLNDVDNVGRTGRHMTCFTMGAHHAFNSLENEVYWKDETIKFCHDFIVYIGIDPEEITFIESWWEGGGNAGPCYEVCVRGVELATLVFMQYKILPNGEKEEIPIKTVDTGYGLERFAWISQGTPTAYDACFGPVIGSLRDLIGVDFDENDKEILAANAYIAGMMDIETVSDIKILREKVAEKLNVKVDDLLAAIEVMEAIYIIADHSRCLAFMLADGVIPSNVKEGYLSRLILRRIMRFMKELEMKESLSDVMEIQLDFLSSFYPEIRDSEDHIMNIINLEEERYVKTIEKGRKIVERMVKKLKKEGKKSMPVDTLIDLYDSHGMPPEIVYEIVKKKYNEEFVNIPDNFFTLVANQHEMDKKEVNDEYNIDYPGTVLLFYDDFNKLDFKAKVLGVVNFKGDICVILDQTVFYPEGGGQPSDKGYIDFNSERYYIKHAEKIDGVVLHKIDLKGDNKRGLEDKFKDFIGEVVKGKIDWSRRIALARNHTATHLIIAASKRVLGEHIWQAGAQKGLDKSRLDLYHYKRISQEEINEIERIANGFVMENISIDINFMSRNLAEKNYGFTLYQGGVVPGSNIRVVNIPYVDVQACAGTHVSNTGDIGLIKINKTERIQDGVERIDFSAGESAINSMQLNDEYLRESSDVFKVINDQLPKTCDRFFSEWKSYKNEINKLRSEIASLKINSLADGLIEVNGLRVLNQLLDSDIKELQKITTDFIDNDKADLVILGNNEGKLVGAASDAAVNDGIRINEIVRELAVILGGSGGGRPTFAQGAGSKTNKMKDALDNVIGIIRKG